MMAATPHWIAVALQKTNRKPPSGPYENVVRLLIELGADLDAVDDDGLTPLDAAALGEGAQLARLLLSCA
ncbi:MAG: ankyrin repeat domain-containing protein [Acidobacteria bacterium]|nr:ankyrin repeat domain-containing protein [Acidobacteriota bacterium]